MKWARFLMRISWKHKPISNHRDSQDGRYQFCISVLDLGCEMCRVFLQGRYINSLLNALLKGATNWHPESRGSSLSLSWVADDCLLSLTSHRDLLHKRTAADIFNFWASLCFGGLGEPVCVLINHQRGWMTPCPMLKATETTRFLVTSQGDAHPSWSQC